MTLSKKVSKQDIANHNVNTAEGSSKLDLEAEMEKYLGGDDEVLQGFYDSGDEGQFDSINPDTHAQ